ncbi:MAG: DUF362 domain-containing protein, partial [Candidatus Omnitrophica bacterium]|nr:DUF362 domain-containing protein [Candidatus Omnitrophota bacterium]
MKSKVYFIPSDNKDDIQAVQLKLSKLLEKSLLMDVESKGGKACIKLHFGEDGNTGYVKPEFVRVLRDDIVRRGASCFISDTNTLYKGRRTNSKDHLALAYEHGFRPEITGAEVVIPDDTIKENCCDIEIKRKFIRVAKVARIFVEADAIVGAAHFKGHIMTGFGGALKNLGMGCATREGKLSQHSDVSPVVILNKCAGCGECVGVCLAGAISIKKKKASIESVKCTGCASCIARCPKGAIEVNWEAGGGSIQQKMVEFAGAVLKNKAGKACFVNFATKITKECDCLAKDDPRISPDVGIIASTDPVSVDKASFDLTIEACGKDIFKEAHPKRDGLVQIKHAAELGLGNIDYELVR